MVLNTPASDLPHRLISSGILAQDSHSAPGNLRHHVNPFGDDGQSKIPWMPIWLQTLSILC
jgi:hypothetical protein